MVVVNNAGNYRQCTSSISRVMYEVTLKIADDLPNCFDGSVARIGEVEIDRFPASYTLLFLA